MYLQPRSGADDLYGDRRTSLIWTRFKFNCWESGRQKLCFNHNTVTFIFYYNRGWNTAIQSYFCRGLLCFRCSGWTELDKRLQETDGLTSCLSLRWAEQAWRGDELRRWALQNSAVISAARRSFVCPDILCHLTSYKELKKADGGNM